MADGDNPSFQTTREPVDSNTEFQWGGSDGKSWSDTIDTSTGITVTDSGSVQSGNDILDSGGKHQWNWTEGSGTTVVDNNGSLDLSFTGLTWSTGFGTESTFGVLDGTDDYADLNTSSWTNLINNSFGTVSMWIQPQNDNGAAQVLAGSQLTSSDNNFDISIVYSVPEYRFSVTSTEDATVKGGDPTGDVNDWINLTAVVGDGGTNYLYIARPGNSYSVSQLGSTATQTSTSGDWSTAPSIGREAAYNQRFYHGAMDISFFDTAALTQSDVQSWVDNTKEFYQ